jgi:acyl-coenzyme A synthetase/AMP-(fatty) acid ligase
MYLPDDPEFAISMSPARASGPFTTVFGGFQLSARDRIQDSGAKFLITADKACGASSCLKANADEALTACPTVEE